jgi:hypothetical protein
MPRPILVNFISSAKKRQHGSRVKTLGASRSTAQQAMWRFNRVTRVKILAMVLLCARSASATEKSNFTFSAAYGSNPVGFRVVEQYDYTRSYQRVDSEGNLIAGERARPIQTLIWYPAQAVPGAKPMLFGRYLDLIASEDSFRPLSAQQRAATLKALLEASSMSRNYERERVQVTKAVEDARPHPGPFPVVLYAPSLSGSAFENSDLCEYLASHGFIVLSSPSLGMHSRGMTWDLEGIEAQVGDLEFLWVTCAPSRRRTRRASRSRAGVGVA